MTRGEQVTWRALELYVFKTEERIQSLCKVNRVEEAEWEMNNVLVARELLRELNAKAKAEGP